MKNKMRAAIAVILIAAALTGCGRELFMAIVTVYG